ncbi:MAG: tRNA (adenosine(37)-N6)-dimethylallyltransferase MiaA [Candidatus Omnitrophica bacterium]|nr:tRNA (adenosine(37)-N6)-dimethylallyltransferase MiaA [Candidatus Omnitrophota bacterium]
MKKKIVFIVGPTGIGKTETAVLLAKKIKAEIVSCDSMQVYKHMDILTSKPGLKLRKLIPHHLVDIVPPAKEYNVSVYRKAAVKKIKDILKRGKVPLLAGGTGHYMSVLIDGIFKAVVADQNIRGRLYKEAARKGSGYLYESLQKIDPQAASKIHPNDVKRIVRALEVFKATGKPISELQKDRKGLSEDYDIRIFCLDTQRPRLYRRIEKRVDEMFKQGLVGEVKKLLKLKLSRTASYAIGIREIKGYLEGWYDLEEAKRLIKRNTRLYAKRQLTWFRKDKRIQWIKVGVKEKPKAIADKIFKLLR